MDECFFSIGGQHSVAVVGRVHSVCLCLNFATPKEERKKKNKIDVNSVGLINCAATVDCVGLVQR